MGVKRPQEKRSEDRQRALGFVSGRLTAQPSGTEVRVRLVDFTSAGMGIRTHRQLLPDTNLVWEIDGQVIELEIMWGITEAGEALPYRYGLMCKSGHDLLVLFENE